MRYLFIWSVLFFLLPLTSKAAVTINEIAWMGSAESANHEWIELYNDGGPVSVDGWILSDGENLNIELAGTISAGDYAVLERTSDDSALGSAFLIYTGALKNTGATLTLRRANGGIEDQVAGGDDWENLGGDNLTKETAQYSTSGWITAVATPGLANATIGTPDPDDDDDDGDDDTSSTQSTRNKSTGPAIELRLPDVTLRAEIDAPSQVFVNQPVSFTAVPSGVGDTLLNSLDYQWNFGDLHTAAGKEVSHTFTYPGTYVVHVAAEYARQKTETIQEITVLPVALSLSKNRQGDVQINNDSPYAIDISNYRLRGNKSVILPENTWLLAQQTITIPRQTIGHTSNALIALYDGVGKMITSRLPAHLVSATEQQLTFDDVVTPTSPPPVFFPSATPATQVANAAIADPAIIENQVESEVVSSTSLDADQAEPVLQIELQENRSTNWPVMAFIILLSIGCVVLLIQPKRSETSFHE